MKVKIKEKDLTKILFSELKVWDYYIWAGGDNVRLKVPQNNIYNSINITCNAINSDEASQAVVKVSKDQLEFTE